MKFYKIKQNEIKAPIFLNLNNCEVIEIEFPLQLRNYISLSSLSMDWEEEEGEKKFILFYKDKIFLQIEPCLAGIIKKDEIFIAPLQCYGTYIVSHYWESYLNIPQHPIENKIFQFHLTEKYEKYFYEYFINDKIKISYTLYDNYKKVSMITPTKHPQEIITITK